MPFAAAEAPRPCDALNWQAHQRQWASWIIPWLGRFSAHRRSDPRCRRDKRASTVKDDPTPRATRSPGRPSGTAQRKIAAGAFAPNNANAPGQELRPVRATGSLAVSLITHHRPAVGFLDVFLSPTPKPTEYAINYLTHGIVNTIVTELTPNRYGERPSARKPGRDESPPTKPRRRTASGDRA